MEFLKREVDRFKRVWATASTSDKVFYYASAFAVIAGIITGEFVLAFLMFVIASLSMTIEDQKAKYDNLKEDYDELVQRTVGKTI